jgi:pyruvate formate lyase activating enzyme
VAPYVDRFFIDVKDMNPDIYRSYTSQDNLRVLENLRWLAEHADPGKVTIRLPHIPDYNTQDDIARSRQQLEAMGFSDIDCFEYITPNEEG